MQKGLNFSLFTVIILDGSILIEWLVTTILKYYDLRFRSWVTLTFFVLMMLLGFALFIGLIYTFSKMFSLPLNQEKKRCPRWLFSVIGLVLSVMIIGISLLFWLLMGMVNYKSEYIVDKYDQKRVAKTSHIYHDTTITYYEYKNFLVSGYDVISFENYGSGSHNIYDVNNK